jgi:dUTP pyrophosphatase
MKIIIESEDTNQIPVFANSNDAGFDLKSNEEKIILPNERTIIKTGIRIKIPEGHVGIIKDRSGLASKNGLHCLAGVIDSGYRGEIGIVIINFSKDEFKVEKGMRIAQMLIFQLPNIEIVQGKVEDDSQRGIAGFGSSGLK